MNRIFALFIFSLLNSTLPSFAQAIYPEPMCELDLDSLHIALKKNHYKAPNSEYILILVNTGVDKHTMAHLVHYSYVRIRKKFGHIPITWVFNEILTPNKKAQEYMLRNVMRLPLEDTNSVYLFNDDLFNNLWQQIEKKCKHKSSLKIDAFPVMNSNVYDAIRLKTEKIENLYIPLHSSGLRLEKISDLPDSLAFSPLSQTTVLPDGNLIRVERADNKLYYINYHTGKTQVLWEYDYDKALDFFINVMAWDEEARQKAQEMGLYPPDWNRESFRLVSVKATKDKLFVTATFEAPCPLDKDITYINAEGEQKTMETANTWGYCAFGMFGIAHFQNFTDSIVITNWRWRATPLQELPKPYDKYLVSDPESFVLLNDTTIAFPTVNYDWKFDRTICYILPFFCQIRYAFKKKFTPSVVSYTFNPAKEGFLRYDTVLPPYRNFRQYLIGSETGSILTQVAGKTYIFPTKVAFEYDKVGNKKIKQELDVVNNKKKKHIGILGILFVGNKLNKIPAFLINVESVNDNTAILYFRFGNHYLQIYDDQWRTRVTLPLDSLEAYKTCLNTLKDNNKVLCFFGKTAIDLPNRKLFMFTATPKGNKLYIYKF